jgi:hypothetical protein
MAGAGGVESELHRLHPQIHLILGAYEVVER